ncbi:MAG: relaxase/mobilization nuclease domain-containing protein [Alphaproteobacteria bacterium]
MIIKSHIRAGYRAAADYLKEQGKNEHIRLVEISDPDATDLDQAFHNMWLVASTTKAKKPLHHISINPFKDERLTDKQVQQIVERCEQKYGYSSGDHQRVIVEHIKDGRQHFHVIWNRVSLGTGKAIWPGHHWLKSKQVCREMEGELGLKRPISRKTKRLKLSGPSPRPNPPSRISRPAKYYAGMLGEQAEMNTHKKKKGGKKDGDGGGATTGISVHKTTKNETTAPVKNWETEIGKGNGPERRRKNMWVAVERRTQKPKS